MEKVQNVGTKNAFTLKKNILIKKSKIFLKKKKKN